MNINAQWINHLLVFGVMIESYNPFGSTQSMIDYLLKGTCKVPCYCLTCVRHKAIAERLKELDDHFVSEKN